MNVHPTKHEVHFLHEDVIIDCIQKTIHESLLSCNSSRTYYTQSLLPSTSSKVTNKGTSQQEGKASVEEDRVYDYRLVRTDAKEKKLDSFAVPKSLSPKSKICDHNVASSRKTRKPVHLTSILSLQNDIKKNIHNGVDYCDHVIATMMLLS